MWTRIAAAPDTWGFSPPEVSAPFLSSGGRVWGWHTYTGCSLCQIIVAPLYRAVVNGVTLPSSFPLSRLRMSPNGRYFAGDGGFWGGARHFDAETGVVTDLPAHELGYPLVRELADDGAVLLAPAGEKGRLALWRPAAEVRTVYEGATVAAAVLTADGRRAAFETVAGEERTLIVLDLATGERIPVAPLPAGPDSIGQMAWDGSGTRMLYRMGDSLLLWDLASRDSRHLLAHTEGIASSALSGDGRTAWALTNANRLLRIDLARDEVEDILPPLGAPGRVDGEGVPGSAVLIRGNGFDLDHTVLDGQNQFPVAGADADGLWFQTPWENVAAEYDVRPLLFRRPGNPFESSTTVGFSMTYRPRFARDIQNVVKAVHDDFSSLVTAERPARPGETIHVYLTGLGPLDRPVPTGVPGPSQPHARPITPFACYAQTDHPAGLRIPFLAYAEGLIGIYQADLTLPDALPDGTIELRCTMDNRYLDSGVLHTRPRLVQPDQAGRK